MMKDNDDNDVSNEDDNEGDCNVYDVNGDDNDDR